jgi:hypothetical protein
LITTHTHTNTNTHTGETCRYLARAVSSTCRFVYSISLPLFSLSLSLSPPPLRLSLFLSFPVFSFCVFLSFYACCSFSLSSLARSFSLSLSLSLSLSFSLPPSLLPLTGIMTVQANVARVPKSSSLDSPRQREELTERAQARQREGEEEFVALSAGFIRTARKFMRILAWGNVCVRERVRACARCPPSPQKLSLTSSVSSIAIPRCYAGLLFSGHVQVY